MMTVFENVYRDAANFKAFGQVGFEGKAAPEELESIRGHFLGDGLFIAEQLEIPPLYESLYQWSGGPTSSDHCWHEFVGVTEMDEAALPTDSYRGGSVAEFLDRLRAVVSWDEELSPHFRMKEYELRGGR